MNSIIGRNAQYCCERYGIKVENVANCSFSVNTIDNIFIASESEETINRVSMISELIMCRDGLLNFTSSEFDNSDVNLFIESLCTN
jgi:hypothetical protein